MTNDTSHTPVSPHYKALAAIVEAACAAPTNVFGYGIWTHHLTDVVALGRRLAPQFEADAEVVELAALLHDYASVKDEALYAEHHVHGPIEAARLLRRFGYPEQTIEAVKEAIAAHRGSVPVPGASAAARCLRNADALAHLRNVPSLLYLAFVQHGMTLDEGTRWVREKLVRSWGKLDAEVQGAERAAFDAALQLLGQVGSATLSS